MASVSLLLTNEALQASRRAVEGALGSAEVGHSRLREPQIPSQLTQPQLLFVCESLTASSCEAQIQSDTQLFLLNKISSPRSYLCPVEFPSAKLEHPKTG